MKKKKMLSILLAAAMCFGLLAGCGSDTAGESETETPAESETETPAAEEEAEVAESAAGEGEEKPLDGVHLKMAINAEYAPFESVNEDGEIVGFDVELNELLAEKLGYTYEIDDMDFTGLVPAIQSGRDDYCISALSTNEEREKVVDFTEGYYTPVTVILVPKGSEITSVADLSGKKVGVQLGSEFEAYANSLEGAEVISYESVTGAVKLIGTSELDCIITDSSGAFGYIGTSGDTLEYRVIKTSETEGYFHPYCIVFPKDSEYVEIFNNALDELVADGTMEELQAKWFGEDYTSSLEEAE